MPTTRRAIVIALASLASSASAKVLIKNHCKVPVNVVQSHNGGCDYGPAGPDACVAGGRPNPWVIQAGGVLDVPYLSDSDAVAIKINKGDINKITQVEYCASDHRYWDLSDIDGNGAARTGSPFYNDNVGLIPSGSGLGAGTCKPVLCQGGQQCEDAYQFPDQTATRVCPLDTGVLTLELCMDQQELDALLQRWYPDGARTNLGLESGLQGDASYEGSKGTNNGEYGGGNSEEIPTGNNEEIPNGNNQECQVVNGQGCQVVDGQCQSTDGQQCHMVNGQCQIANAQECQSTGTVPQSEPAPAPAPISTTIPATGNVPESTNTDGHYRSHRPNRNQKRNATPSMRPRPRHLRAHQHQGHSRRMHALRVARAAMKE